MDVFKIRAINDHKELTARINKLASFITACQTDMVKGECKVDTEDYALMRIQLEYMINYHDILESRLNKHGIIVDGERYFEDVTKHTEIRLPENSKPSPGSDFDVDADGKSGE